METACKLSKPDQGQWGMHNLNWLTGILAQRQDQRSCRCVFLSGIGCIVVKPASAMPQLYHYVKPKSTMQPNESHLRKVKRGSQQMLDMFINFVYI